ncbi:hypothetical protein [Streptomyces sp. NA02536]|uniref:hypothetical protein n=1 Tax=Streptomyces sp. NA02536 TaxID=2742133 RepID=UPI0020CB293B|nr:hypothetical protein [Streptomyces sp. NA02536]
MVPLVPALAGLVVDVVWVFDSCGDDEANLDSAVKMVEGVGGELLRLPLDQHDRPLRVLAVLAEGVRCQLAPVDVVDCCDGRTGTLVYAPVCVVDVERRSPDSMQLSPPLSRY